MGPEELGWAALAAWSCANLARVAALAMQLQMRLSPDDEISRRWWLLLRLVTAESAGAEETGRRVEAVVSAVRSGARVPARFRRLALAVSGRLLLAENRRDEAADLLAWERGSGPEGAACDWLRARARPDVEDRPAARRPAGRGVPGLEFLVSGSANMHLVDGLSGLLAVVEDSEDDAAVLTGGCRWVCRQAGALAVAVVSADGATLVAAENWRRADLAGEIGEVLNGPARDARQPDHDAAASSFGVSIRYGGVTIGFVVARGRAADRAALQQAAHAFAALGGSALRARLDALTVSQRAHAAVPEIVGDSPLIAAVRDAVTRAAAAPFPVLIEGESGTGKELVARALHRLGPRRDHRLSAVNCAALNDELVEAELFGHARGAFTGAVGPRTGLFEEAHGGTLFLDEVTELSPRAQAKLLRVLQEREVRRVGENVPRAIDVRLIAACNVPLADAVVSGRFRDDLRFRLAVVRIRLPALRERIEDVPALARLFWRRAAAEAGARATLGSDALVRLTQHAWPGNVRELQNVIAGLVVAAPARGRVTRRHVDQVLSHATTAGESPGVPLDAARRTFERRMIAAALVRHAGRRTAAASELGLTRQGLTKALRRLGLAAEEDAAGVA
jgi:DNA-binding NtrC family response regulator